MHHNEPSQRQRRVGEQIRHILAESLQRGHFGHPLLLDEAANITVSEVRMSPDLKHARAYIAAFGKEDLSALLHALNEEAYGFQKDINRNSNLKFTPRVKFVTDESFEEAAKIEQILKEIS